jgi:hypothetical protein
LEPALTDYKCTFDQWMRFKQLLRQYWVELFAVAENNNVISSSTIFPEVRLRRVALEEVFGAPFLDIGKGVEDSLVLYVFPFDNKL